MRKSRSVSIPKLKAALGQIASVPKAEIDCGLAEQRKANTSRPKHWDLCVTVSIPKVGPVKSLGVGER